MSLYRITDPSEIQTPVLVAAFDGWVDAGRAATMAAEQLLEAGASRIVATFDADRLYDYRSRRPTLDIVDGTLLDLSWPELHLRATRIGDHDLLVLTGPEPDYRWRELASDVVALIRELRVTSWVSLGAIPVAAPHTRPVQILGTASARGLLPPDVVQGPDGRLRVPSAALSVLELEASRSGVASLGLYAHVPHYVSAAYPTGAIELLRRLGQYLAVEIPLGKLPGQALETRALLDAATAEGETKAYVQRLEEMADEARLPAGDELIADIERFLRDRGGGTGGGDDRPN